MRKFIFLFCVLFVSTQQVFASNNILEEKYKELADLVDKDINFVKESVSKIESNLTELQIVQQLIDEVNENYSIIDNSNQNNQISLFTLGNALTGAIFYYPAYTAGVNHGHVGIYVSNYEIAEAPGGNNTTQVIDAQYATMVEGQTDIYIVNAATTAQKNNAGSWARSIANLNLPYNDAFWSNKYCKTTDYYNCSQLVWCAYKQTSNIDLDSNLGFGVYPNDIISSSSLTYARTD